MSGNAIVICSVERGSQRESLLSDGFYLSLFTTISNREERKKLVIASAPVGRFWWLPASQAVLYSLPLQSIIIHLIGHVKAPIYRLNIIIVLIVVKSCQISK